MFLTINPIRHLDHRQQAERGHLKEANKWLGALV